MTVLFCCVLIALSAFGAEAGAEAGTIIVPLAPVNVSPAGSTILEMSLERPEGEWRLPRLTGQRPLYGIYEFRGKRLLMVLDRTARSKADYDRLWFDVKGNGDLRGGEPTIARDTHSTAHFRGIGIPYEVDGETRQYSVDVSFHFNNPYIPLKALSDDSLLKSVRGYVRPERRMGGEFDLNGTTYGIQIADATADGWFNDHMRLVEPARPGREKFSIKGDWLFLYEGGQRWEFRWELGHLLYLQGQLYRVTVDPHGEWLKLEPEPGPLVELELCRAPHHISVISTDGSMCVLAYQPGGSIKVPAGDYRLLDYVLLRDDGEGNYWLLRGDGTVEGAAVTAGSGESLIFGDPFSVGIVSFDTYIVLWAHGSGNELIEALFGFPKDMPGDTLVLADVLKPESPAYRIVTDAGEIMASGSFEYG